MPASFFVFQKSFRLFKRIACSQPNAGYASPSPAGEKFGFLSLRAGACGSTFPDFMVDGIRRPYRTELFSKLYQSSHFVAG
jgi:hypothetical protein